MENRSWEGLSAYVGQIELCVDMTESYVPCCNSLANAVIITRLVLLLQLGGRQRSIDYHG